MNLKEPSHDRFEPKRAVFEPFQNGFEGKTAPARQRAPLGEGGGVRNLRRNLKESVVGEVVGEETTTQRQRLLGKKRKEQKKAEKTIEKPKKKQQQQQQ